MGEDVNEISLETVNWNEIEEIRWGADETPRITFRPTTAEVVVPAEELVASMNEAVERTMASARSFEVAYMFSKEEEKTKMGDGIEKREYTDFKVGDLVKVRPMKDVQQQFGKYGMRGAHTSTSVSYVEEMATQAKDTLFVITQIFSKTVYLSNIDFKSSFRPGCWSWNTDMIELVEEGYMSRIKKERKEYMKDLEVKTIENEDEIIKEMISKVDKEKFTKILAGSADIRLEQVKGVDKILEQWAKAKARIYLLLGKELTIQQEIQFPKTGKEIKQEAEELLTQFPRLL